MCPLLFIYVQYIAVITSIYHVTFIYENINQTIQTLKSQRHVNYWMVSFAALLVLPLWRPICYHLYHQVTSIKTNFFLRSDHIDQGFVHDIRFHIASKASFWLLNIYVYSQFMTTLIIITLLSCFMSHLKTIESIYSLNISFILQIYFTNAKHPI